MSSNSGGSYVQQTVEQSATNANSADVKVYMGVVYTFLMLGTMYIVWYYAEPGFPYLTYLTLTITYFASFGVMLLVPFDMGCVLVDRRSHTSGFDPVYNYHIAQMNEVYNAFFSIILIFSSVILVFEEYFNTDGYFTLMGRLCSSFKRMVIDTVLGLVAGLVVLGILLGQKIVPNDPNVLKLTAIVVTNTVYEGFLMFLLAYGLVEYPKSFWECSNLEHFLLRTQMKATMDYKDISIAQLEVSEQVAHVRITKEQLAAYGDQKLNDAIDIILEECPKEFQSTTLGKVATNKSGQITIDTLAALRYKLNFWKDRYRMAVAKVESTKITAYYLEDCVAAQKREDGQKIIKWTVYGRESTEWEYTWHIILRPLIFKFLSLFYAFISVLSFLGCICSMNGVPTNASVYYLIVHDPNATTGGIALFVFLTFGYMIWVTFWSLFQVKFVGLAEPLVPGSTTPEALSFNVRMVSRLAAPLAFFYLGWLAENGLENGPWTFNQAPNYRYDIFTNATYVNATQNVWNNTLGTYQTVSYMQYINATDIVYSSEAIPMPSAFSHFYQLQEIPIIKKTFGTIFPSMLITLVVLFATNIFNRLLVMCKLDHYQMGKAIVSEEALKDGKRQLARHKSSVQSKFRREGMRDFISKLREGNADASMFGAFFRGGPKNKKFEYKVNELPEPSPLQGNVSRKVGGRMTSSWKDLYAKVRAPGELDFWSSEADFNNNEPTDSTAKTIELKLVSDFRLPTKKSSDAFCLELDMVESIILLRFTSQEDLDTWMTGLAAWKSYSIEMSQQNAGLDDLDLEIGDGSKPIGNTADLAADLENIDIGQAPDEEFLSALPQPKKTLFGGLFGGGKKKKAAKFETLPEAEVENNQPDMLEGWLEKKTGHMSMNKGWHNRYCRVNVEAKAFQYFKTSSPREEPSGHIDLAGVDVAQISYYSSKDHSRFNIETGDKTYKFKAKSANEGEKWVKGLEAWKEYFLLESPSGGGRGRDDTL